MYSSTTLVGRVGRDPEVRSTSAGGQVANLSVATSRPIKQDDGSWGEATEWHRVVIFGKAVDYVEGYVNKGDLVLIVGEIRTRQWQDQSGADRYSTEVVIAAPGHRVSRVSQAPGQSSGSAPASRSPAPRQTGRAREKVPDDDSYGYSALDDDIPF